MQRGWRFSGTAILPFPRKRLDQLPARCLRMTEKQADRTKEACFVLLAHFAIVSICLLGVRHLAVCTVRCDHDRPCGKDRDEQRAANEIIRVVVPLRGRRDWLWHQLEESDHWR